MTKLRALVDMSLRKSADEFVQDEETGETVTNPAWEEWYNWKAGETFEAPPNLMVALALKRGIAEEVTAKKGGADDD